MSTYLRKIVVLGASGIASPGSDQDYRSLSNSGSFAETRTGWVRLWAPWYLLQLNSQLSPDDPAQPGAASWAALNAQVDQARAAGLRVIITSYGYTYWSNGSSQYYDGNGTAVGGGLAKEEREDGYADRYIKGNWDSYVAEGLTDSAAARHLHTNKTHYLRFSQDVSASSPWGAWIDFLIQTFAGRAWGIEVCNEPSTQNWPLQGPSITADAFANGPLTVQNVIADMFKTAHEKNAARSYPVRILGPATLDLLSSGNRRATDYSVFTDQLLVALSARGFLGDQAFLWSQHNYADVLYDLGPGSWREAGDSGQDYQTLRAAAVRMKLVNANWQGYTDADTPSQSVWLTEGGADLQRVSDVYYGTQAGLSFNTSAYQRAADLIERAWNRVHNDSPNALGQNGGYGIGVFSNYLWYSSVYPNDTGLRENASLGSPRESYTTWKILFASP